MLSTSDLKKGSTIELDNKLCAIMEYEHIKMGRGSAQVRIKFRDVRSGAIFERTFQAGTRWPRARVERREMQYMYRDEQFFYFMNTETFEQIPVNAATVGDAERYLRENDLCQLVLYGEEVIGIEMPLTVEMTVVQTDPGIKGDTAAGGTKPATTDTGLVVNVPLFVDEGTRIRVNTESGAYIERVN
jgi:elongation factor P